MDADDFAWTPEFFRRLVAALPRDDWPSPASFYWQTYRRALRDNAVTEAEATEAVHRLVVDPPRFLDRCVAELLAAVRAIRLERAESGPDASFERAAAESAKCGRCCGEGIVPVVCRYADGRKASAPAHCTCPIGRFKRQSLKDPELLAGYIDLAEVPWRDRPADAPEPETPAAPAPRRKPGEPKPLGEIL